MSFTNVLDRRDKGLAPVGARVSADPHRMRAEFPDLWARYLVANYGRAESVADAFGVTFQTACNWLSGVSRPTGDKVMLEMAAHPDRMLELVGSIGRAA